MITPGEIAGLASGGYLSAGLCAARFMYHRYNFEHDFDRVPASVATVFVWPFVLLIFSVIGFVTAPTRSERRATRLEKEKRAQEQRAFEIRRLERELGIGQPDPPPPAKPVHPVVAVVKAAMGIQPRAIVKPDQRCAFCIPGRGPVAPNYCPFYPVCQQ